MRTKSSLKNMLAIILTNFFNIILGMISTTLFIKTLGIEYMGVNGLFSNIISMLNIVELGLGNAIIVNLYKPIHNNDKEQIKSLIHFYKKIYNIIIILMTIIGLALIPFLKLIVGSTTAPINIQVAYLLVLLSSISSYILAYKRSLLYAYQKEYLTKIIVIVFLFLCNILQITSLIITKNYYLYLIIKIICQIVENKIISLVADHKFAFIKEKDYQELDKETKRSIWQKVSALSIHKISYFIVNGTDNIIISTFLGVISVGMYSNYYMIINNVKNILYQVLSSTTASIGDLLVENDSQKTYETFKKITFINAWLAIFCSICLLMITQDFICLWIGKKYLLDELVLIVLVINFYQKVLQRTYKNFKDAAGIWIEDKYVPIIESVLNIVISIICLKFFGLAGVFMGTIMSSFVYWFYSYPKFVYKKLLNKSYSRYILENIGYLLILILTSVLTYKVIDLFTVSNILLQVIIDIIICCIIPNIVLIIIFYRTAEFKYFCNLIKKFLSKLKGGTINETQSI